MLVAQRQNDTRVIAWKTQKSDGPFFCPVCHAGVILKKGTVREHHFAHQPPVFCQYGAGETELHLRAKRELYDALRAMPQCSKCELERPLSGVRPDVSLYIGTTPVAVELQRSTLPIAEIYRRTLQYTKLGIHLLWVLPFAKPDEAVPYRPRQWEKYLHALYFGRVYFWYRHAWVQSASFTPHRTWVEERTWYEDGEEVSAGGYYRMTKTLKDVEVEAHALNIATDFKPLFRSKFETNAYQLPAAKLWIDNQEE